MKQPSNDVVLVLGNHSLTPLAAIPLLEMLNRNDIRLRAIFASGSGSLLAALCGMGLTPGECVEALCELGKVPMFKHVNLRSMLSLLPFFRSSFKTPASIFNPKELQKAYKNIFGDATVESCSPKLYLQTTNVYNSDGVVLTKGLLRDAVYASTVSFPMHPPIFLDNQWLANGSFSQSLPLSVAVKEINADVFIAVNAMQELKITRSYPYFISSFFDNVYANIERPQHLVSIDVHHHAIIFIPISIDKEIEFHHLDPEKIERIFAASKEKIDERSHDILEALNPIQ